MHPALVRNIVSPMSSDPSPRLTQISSPEGGDKKKARDRLRMLNRTKTHHFSAFQSGVYLGLALPALVVGIYQGRYLSLTRSFDLLWDTPHPPYSSDP